MHSGKTFTLLLALTLAFSTSALAAPIWTSVPVDSTYLRISGDTASAPVFIPLASIPGAGEVLRVTTSGGLCYHLSMFCLPTELGVVFTSDNSLLAGTNLNRLTAIGPPVGVTSVVSPATWSGGLSTDITQDFAAPSATWLNVLIPAGANYIAVGVIDSHFSDNRVWSGQPLQLGTELVPEPGTLVFLATGLGVLLLPRRLQLRGKR